MVMLVTLGLMLTVLPQKHSIPLPQLLIKGGALGLKMQNRASPQTAGSDTMQCSVVIQYLMNPNIHDYPRFQCHTP